MEFAIENPEDVWDEGIEIVKRHHEETGTLPEADFSPDKERYFEMSRRGLSVLFTARVEGKLVGYCLLFIVRHLHYSHTIWAHQDILFLEKRHRGIGSVRFLRWMDEQLKENGVSVVIRSTHIKNDYHRLLRHLDYSENSTNYLRRLS